MLETWRCSNIQRQAEGQGANYDCAGWLTDVAD